MGSGFPAYSAVLRLPASFAWLVMPTGHDDLFREALAF
jgi:hypothetical protein